MADFIHFNKYLLAKIFCFQGIILGSVLDEYTEDKAQPSCKLPQTGCLTTTGISSLSVLEALNSEHGCRQGWFLTQALTLPAAQGSRQSLAFSGLHKHPSGLHLCRYMVLPGVHLYHDIFPFCVSLSLNFPLLLKTSVTG